MNQKEEPLVSVIIATYNEKPYFIFESINSILRQTYENMEVLIMDDSTSRDTRNALDQLANQDQRIKLLRSDERLGFVPSLNKGLALAKGTYIARMDADDIATPFRFSKQVTYLEKNPNIYVVGGQMDIINEEGTITSHRSYPLNGLKLFMFSLYRDPLSHPTVMLRRELIDCGFRYDPIMKKAEDIDLWLRIMNKHYKIANLPDTLLKYRVEDNFNKKRTDQKQKDYVAFARKRNFSLARPFFSICSVICTLIYQHMPSSIISIIYSRENNKNQGNMA